MTMNSEWLSLDDVIITSQLLVRPSKSPDYEAEQVAFVALAETMEDAPQTILQKLVETARQLCHADTAGISLLDNHGDAEAFKWVALSGVFEDRLNSTIPRNASPSGVAIDRDSTQLMHMAERFFPAIKMDPPIVEALLVPFHVEHKPIGTIWVVVHNEWRKFDREDERIVKILGQIASATWQLWTARTRAELAALAERQARFDLSATIEELQRELVEHKRAEDQLQRFNQDLETRVQETTGELRHSIEEASQLQEQLRHSQKMENIGTLASGIAHDFNNVLNVIQGYTDLIIHDPPQPQQLIGYVQTIRNNAEQGAALVKQLLTISEKAEVNFAPANIQSLLQQLAKLLIDTFPKKVTIDLKIEPAGAALTLDANQINQALLNLCINARDAMPNGGRLLLQSRTISRAELPKDFSHTASDKYVLISVSDTGSGMEPEIRQRIFEPFFTTKEPGKGTGLGLSMVYSIVSNHGGFMEVASEPGRGSTFHIYLPVTIEPASREGELETR